jgi:hypothetical protein
MAECNPLHGQFFAGARFEAFEYPAMRTREKLISAMRAPRTEPSPELTTLGWLSSPERRPGQRGLSIMSWEDDGSHRKVSLRRRATVFRATRLNVKSNPSASLEIT